MKSATTANEMRRAQSILLTNRRGGGSEVPTLTGLTRSRAINLKQRYIEEGLACLTDKRTRKPKELLTKRQREAVLRAVKEKTPKDYGYAHEHWTSGVLGDLIEKKYKVKYKSKTSRNLRTGTEHAWKTECQTMYVSKAILQRLRKEYQKKKIFLFWDDAGWRKGSVAQEYVKADGNMEIVWLPRCAPDLNPQENVWKAGRSAVTHNEYIENIDTATDALVTYFNDTTFPYSFLGESRIS